MRSSSQIQVWVGGVGTAELERDFESPFPANAVGSKRGPAITHIKDAQLRDRLTLDELHGLDLDQRPLDMKSPAAVLRTF